MEHLANTNTQVAMRDGAIPYTPANTAVTNMTLTQEIDMKSGMFCVVAGIIITAFGVGGVEQSLDDVVMIEAALFSALGLMIMGCGVLMLQNAERA